MAVAVDHWKTVLSHRVSCQISVPGGRYPNFHAPTSIARLPWSCQALAQPKQRMHGWRFAEIAREQKIAR
jgi:hypothetical protein